MAELSPQQQEIRAALEAQRRPGAQPAAEPQEEIRRALDRQVPRQVNDPPEEASGLWEAWKSGWQASITGLRGLDLTAGIRPLNPGAPKFTAFGGDEPDLILPEDATRAERILNGAATIVGDLPALATGGIIGAIAGVSGGPTGVAAGGGGGSEGFTQGMRRWILDQYEEGSDKKSIVDRLVSAGLAGLKGVAIGASAGAVGSKVHRFVTGSAPLPGQLPGGPTVTTGTSRVKSKILQQASVAGVEVPTIVGVASFLEGEIPDMDDFVDAAIMLGGLRVGIGAGQAAAGRRAAQKDIQRRLRDIYEREGKTPRQLMQEAAEDPKVARRVAAEALDRDFPEITPKIRRYGEIIDPPTKRGERADIPAEVEKMQLDPIRAADDSRGREFVNLDTFDLPDGPKQILDDITRGLRDEMRAAQRGRVPVSQTAREAVDALRRLGGEAFLKDLPEARSLDWEVQVAARKILLDAFARDISRKAQRLAAMGDEATASDWAQFDIDFDRATRVQEFFIKGKSSAGRTLNILNQKLRDPAVRENEANFINDFEKVGGKDRAAAMAEMMAHAEDPAAVLHKAKSRLHNKNILSRAFRQYTMALKSFMLSGIQTMQITTLGNLVALATKGQEKFVAAAIGGSRRGIGRLIGRPVSKNEAAGIRDAVMFQYGAVRGGIEALRGAAKVLNSEMGSKGLRKGFAAAWRSVPLTRKLDIIPEGERVQVEGAARDLAKQEGLRPDTQAFNSRVETILNDTLVERIMGPFDGIFRIPYTVASLGDSFSSHIASHATRWEAATRKANAEGLRVFSKEWERRVKDLVDNPTDAVQRDAMKLAERTAFREQGPVTDLLNYAIKTLPILEPWVLLFRTAASAVPRELTRRTPFAPIIKSWREDFMKGGAARDDAIAEVVSGTLIASATIFLARAGFIQGGPHPDPKQRAADREAGKLDYSAVLPGGQQVQIKRWAPHGTLIGLAADIGQAWDIMDEQGRTEAGWALIWASREIFLNQTWLSGLANAVGTFQTPEQFLPKFLEQTATAHVPNLVGSWARDLDPYVRDVNGILDALQSRIPAGTPGLPDRGDLPKIRQGIGGEPVEASDRFWWGSPSLTREFRSDPVVKEAQRLGVAMPAMPRKRSAGSIAGESVEVELTPEERERFMEHAGRRAHDMLSQIISGPAWDQVPELVQKQIFNQVFMDARKEAAWEVLPGHKRQIMLQSFVEEQMAEGRL